MLTKVDLDQIRTVVREEVEPIDKKLDKAQEDISEILTEVISRHDDLDKRVTRVEDHLNLRKI